MTSLLEDPQVGEVLVSGGGPVVVAGRGVTVSLRLIELDDGSFAELVARLAVRRGADDE